MGFFGRQADGASLPLIVGRPWRDAVLDAGIAAVTEGHLLAGRTLLAETRDDPQLRAQRSTALAKAAIGKAMGIAELGRSDLENPDVALWLGETRIQEAWAARGGPYARFADRGEQQFAAIMQTAYEPLMAAAELLPSDPTPWAALQRFGLATRVDPADLDGIWENIQARHPAFFQGAFGRVLCLAGTPDRMLDFARDIVLDAPLGDPIVAMVALAHVENLARGVFGPGMPRRQKYRYLADYFADPRVHYECVSAADRWLTEPRPHPDDIQAHHLFAFAFLRAGDRDRARLHLEAAGDRIPERQPWIYFGDPVEQVTNARRELGLS